jgi:hypothetical protein
MAINKQTIDKIAAQALNEISFARIHKQGKVNNWQKNEEMYYSKKTPNVESRANVNLARMQEFVHTLLSKIDNPLVFKYLKRKNSQLRRVELLNSLRQRDSDKDNWDIKDIVGKKQGIIYGRALYWYFADSINGYQSHLENIDVYDFLIDPACGGIDIEEARYLGAYSVMLDKRALKEGVKNKVYIRSAVDELLAGSGNSSELSQEETNKQTRTYGQGTIGQKEGTDTTKYKFWRWLTTYQEDGERYYMLIDNSGRCIRCDKLTDVSPATKESQMGLWPVWTWAPFPDLTEFWTPGYCDYAREIFMAQDVSINQMLDNAEAINKPMKVVNISAVENLASLKYRRDGIIPTKGDYDANRAVQIMQTPSISTPIQVFNILEAIQEKSSGVTAGSKGVSDEQGKVGIYEGNQAAAADRFGLLNKSYSQGYRRFGKLHELGVREHLTKKVAVDIMGPQGIEIVEVSRRDLFRKDDEYAISVEASNAETLASNQDKLIKTNFLTANSQNEIINKKKSFEIAATIAGFTEDEIEELLDTSVYGNSALMSECDRDIERLIDNEKFKPNRNANLAYKQKLLNYMQDHEEDMNDEMFKRFADYMVLIEEIVMKNEARALQQEQILAMQAQTAQGMPQGAPGRMGSPKGEAVLGEQQPSPEVIQ